MTSPAFESFLARIYTDVAARRRFLDDPEGVARSSGLSAEECAELAAMDRTGLEMAARVFTRKRARLKPRSWFSRFLK